MRKMMMMMQYFEIEKCRECDSSCFCKLAYSSYSISAFPSFSQPMVVCVFCFSSSPLALVFVDLLQCYLHAHEQEVLSGCGIACSPSSSSSISSSLFPTSSIPLYARGLFLWLQVLTHPLLLDIPCCLLVAHAYT